MSNAISDILTIMPYPYNPGAQPGCDGQANQQADLQALAVKLRTLLLGVDLNDPEQLAYFNSIVEAYDAAYAQATPTERLQADIVSLLEVLDPRDPAQMEELQGLVDQLGQTLLPQNQAIYDQLDPTDPQSVAQFLSWISTIEPTNPELAEAQTRVIAEFNAVLEYGGLDDPAFALQVKYIVSLFFSEFEKSGGTTQVSDAIATINTNSLRMCSSGGWMRL